MADGEKTERDKITFHLIKAPQFLSHRVDGAIGGIAPAGVSLSFFVERMAIPKTVTHEILPDGTLGKIVDATGKEGIVREIQAGVLLNVESARTLAAQLGKMLAAYDAEQKENDDD